jgi:DNA-binding transcriptional ArsR family regulator
VKRGIELEVLPQPRLDLPCPDVAAAVTAADLLADPIRAGILRLLGSGPHCVCELAAALGARENNVSNHLAKLRDAGLVLASRNTVNGRFLYYERDQRACTVALHLITELLA